MEKSIARDEGVSIRRHLLGGVVIALMLTVGVGGWATTTELSGAVIAPGSIVVDSNVKKVQHLTGGIVGELLVRDGQRVRAGEVVLRLDETITRVNLAIVTKGLDEMTARQARLASERDQAEQVAFPATLLARANEPDVAAAIQSEAQAVRAAAQRPARPEVAAQGAHRPARRGGPRVHGPAGGKSRGDRADPARARRRTGALEQETWSRSID